MNKNNGVFPVINGRISSAGGNIDVQQGISKREFYAALAMQAMIAAQVVSVGKTPQAAKAAFAYADAMIAEAESEKKG